MSAFARSVAAHVKALLEPNAGVWSPEDAKVGPREAAGLRLQGIVWLVQGNMATGAECRRVKTGDAKVGCKQLGGLSEGRS